MNMIPVPHTLPPLQFVTCSVLGLLIGTIAVLPGREWVLASFAAVIVVTGVASWLLASVSRWVFLLIASVLLLPPLPMPWGNSGVHPAIALAAIGIVVGIGCIDNWKLHATANAAALAAFSAALWLSVPWAILYSGGYVAAGSAARVGLFCIAVYVFFYLAYGPGRTVRASHFVRLLFWAGFASVTFAVIDFFLQLPAPARFADQFVWLSSGVYRRAQGVFYESSTLGSFSALLLVTIAAVSYSGAARDLKLPRIALLFAGVAAFVALICSFSRTAVLNAVASGLALIWLKRAQLTFLRRGFWTAGSVGLCIIAGLLVLSATFPEFLGAYVLKLQHSAEFFVSDPNVVLSQRLESWARLWEFLQDHPWHSVLGIGYKTLPYTEYLGAPIIADNMYLSILIETGLPGLMTLLLLSAAILGTAYRSAQSTDPAVALSATIVFCFWCGELLQMLTGDVVTYWRILPAVFGLLAFGARDDNSLPRPVC